MNLKSSLSRTTTHEPLTKRQRAILEFIRSQIRAEGRAPTIRELGSKFGISSTNGVRDHINALIRKGYLQKDNMLSRGIRLVERISSEVRGLPLVGSAPAGTPITAIENFEGEVSVDKSFVSSGDAFTLRVVGDSMQDAGIHNGDLVIVKKQSSANEGDIIVAVVDDEATVKRLRYSNRDGKRVICLQPENPDYQPIYVDPDQQSFYIAGVVEALMRKLKR